MPSILNPYVLLFVLVGALGLFGSGVSIGVKWEKRSTVAAVIAAQTAAIEQANRDAEIEKQRAVSAAKKESDARLATRTARLKGEIDAAKKSRPECSRDAESLGLLNDAIDSANGEAHPGAKLLDEVRPADAPRGWIGKLSEKLGISNGGAVRPVPETPR